MRPITIITIPNIGIKNVQLPHGPLADQWKNETPTKIQINAITNKNFGKNFLRLI